jgi:trans-aconitate 2-methyltransferase
MIVQDPIDIKASAGDLANQRPARSLRIAQYLLSREKVMTSMNWNASDYAKNSHGQFAWALVLVERLSLEQSAVVLDIGCGDGKICVELARRVPCGRVVGIDSSAAMIELAQRTWADKIPNVEFRVCDAQALEFHDEFDLAFSNSTLHWAPDHPAVLRGVAAALKPGGRLSFSMGGRGTAAVVYQALDELASTSQWSHFLVGVRSPHHFYGPEEYNDWLPKAGLTPKRVALVPKPMRHPTVQALEGWIRTVWVPYVERVAEDQRITFLRELTDRVLARCDTEDGALLLPMVNLEVDANKVAA